MSDFNFDLIINRAFVKDGVRYVGGEASNTSVDLYNTVFTENCQRGFVEDISSAFDAGEPLQLEAEHEGDFPFFNIGVIVEGQLNNNKTKIVAKLDRANALADWYWDVLNTSPEENRSLGRPEKLGLSINGYVQESHKEFNGDVGEVITHFDRVKLRRVGVVKNPGNVQCYAEAMKRSLVDLKEQENASEKESEEITPTSNEQTKVGSNQSPEKEEGREIGPRLINEHDLGVHKNCSHGPEDNETPTEELNKRSLISSEPETKIITDDSNELRGNEMSVENENKDLPEVAVDEVVEVVDTAETEATEVVEASEGEKTDDQVDEVVDEVVADEKSDEVDRSSDEVTATPKVDEVTRGELKDQMASREAFEKICELNSMFSDTMWSIAYSHLWGDVSVDEVVNRMNAAVADYGDLCREIMSKRAMDTSNASIQKEDLDDEVTLTYSLKAKLASKNSEVIRSLDNSKIAELEAKIAELQSQLDAEKETVRSLNENLETANSEKEEVERKLNELAEKPVDRAILPDAEKEQVKRDIDIALENNDTISALKLFLFKQK